MTAIKIYKRCKFNIKALESSHRREKNVMNKMRIHKISFMVKGIKLMQLKTYKTLQL